MIVVAQELNLILFYNEKIKFGKVFLPRVNVLYCNFGPGIYETSMDNYIGGGQVCQSFYVCGGGELLTLYGG